MLEQYFEARLGLRARRRARSSPRPPEAGPI
jgi:hypothetical protein